MRIERKLAEGQENVAPLLLEEAYVLNPYASDRRTVSFLEVGKRIDIRAVDKRSGEAGTWVTSPIQEITSALRTEEQRTTE